SGYIAQKGDWGDSAMAYNNAYLLGTAIDVETGEEESDNFVRKDYTKVGLTEYSYQVFKAWDDDDDRDGVRPESITLHLYADGKDTGKTLTLPIENEDGSRSWNGSFKNIPYTDPEGNKIRYSVQEDVPAGYTSAYKLNGNEIVTFTNRHEPELTRLDGAKKWVGDTEDARPESITVRLLGDGNFVKNLTVRPDAEGNWTYFFTDLLKYRDHGVEIVYTVEEVMNGKLLSYIPSVDGNDLINTYHPYGDLVVSKFVTGATDVSKEQYFTFTFTFSKTVEGETVPVFGEYAYEILDEEGTVVSEGTVSNNGTVQIKGGQTIHVKDVDEYVNYTVTEAEKEGFKLTGSTRTSGTIRPNDTMQAEFTNEYSAKGQISLNAEKVLYNRELQRYQFRFEVYQVTVNEDGSETETLIRTGSNNRPDNVTQREDETVESSHANVVFGAIRFTQEDHGKTYTYHIKETLADKAGYTYDETVVTAKVTVTDNGDGTLSIVPVYSVVGEDGEEETVNTALFENTYNAEGELVLRAWKDLQGRRLQDGEFTFELLNEAGVVIQTKSNTADGSVVFDAIHYDEKDIGKTFYYGIREKAGSDPTVYYDDTVYGYIVEVLDNGDGTLSLNQGFAEPIYSDAEPCGTCNDTGSKLEYTISYSQGRGRNLTDYQIAMGVSNDTSYVEYKGKDEALRRNLAQYLKNIVGLEEDIPEAMILNAVFFHKTIGDELYTVGYYCPECNGNGNGICLGCNGTGYIDNGTDHKVTSNPMVFGTRNAVFVEEAGYQVIVPDFDVDYQSGYGDWYSPDMHSFLKAFKNGEYTYEKDRFISTPGNFYLNGNYNIAASIKLQGMYPELAEGYRQLLQEKKGLSEEEAAELIDKYASGTFIMYFNTMGYDSYGGYYRLQYDLLYYPTCEDCGGTGKIKQITGWSTEAGELPVFVNTLKPGNLAVTKYVTNADSADPTQEFRFKIKLIGEEIEDGELHYELDQTPANVNPDSQTSDGDETDNPDTGSSQPGNMGRRDI
ncbi:MAG: Cna B-type domain-containing protein, partial [Solobacterium sp.]|nr:Cna B-type domain-containing protein [Solobacterium sp.]